MPVQTKTVWGCLWFKNFKCGGAQNMAIGYAEADEVVVHSETQKYGRMWGCMTRAKLAELIEKEHGIYEIISQYPHKLYFDLDLVSDKPEPEYLATAVAELQEIFPGSEYVVSGSISDVTGDQSTEEGRAAAERCLQKKYKMSYHLTCQNYAICTPEDRTAVKLLCKDVRGFDKAVYTKNRNMKCVNQAKRDGRVQKLVPGVGMALGKDPNPLWGTDLRTHLITCYLNEFSPIPVPESIVHEVQIKQSIYDMSTLPHIILPDNIDIDALTPLELINAFPVTPAWVYKDTWTLLCFAANNGVTFEQWLEVGYKKHTDYAKWMTQWSGVMPKRKIVYGDAAEDGTYPDSMETFIPSEFKPKSVNTIRFMLRQFYPNAVKPATFFDQFKATFLLGPSERVETLTQAVFLPRGVTVINTGMGSGKTAQTCDFIKKREYCWISPNIALARNLIARTGATFYKDIPQAEKHAGIKSPQLLICMNSLRYVKRTYGTIVLDEIETILQKWMGDFMKHKDVTWLRFVELIRSAKRVIILDAFTTTKTLDVIRAIRGAGTSSPNGALPHAQGSDGPEFRLIERAVEPKTRTVHYVRKFAQMVSKIRTDLHAGKKVFIFYPQKDLSRQYISMEGLYTLLAEEGFAGTFYNSDVDELRKAKLGDVNDAWGKLDFVITNTTITCGVNYDREDIPFDACYLFIAHYTNPRDALQVSYRARKLTGGIIFAHFMGLMRSKDVWENDGDRIEVRDTEERKAPPLAAEAAKLYRTMYAANLVELKSPNRETFEFFCTKAGYRQTQDDEEFAKDAEKNMLEILKEHQMGCRYKGIANITPKRAEEIKEKMFNGTATQIEKYEIGRYYFREQFREEMRDAAEEGWDNQWVRLTRKILHPTQLFEDIAAHNEFTGFPEFLDDVKIPAPIMTEIFKNYTLKYLTEKSAPVKILTHIYNEEYGPIYETKLKGHHSTVSLAEGVADWFSFVKKASRRVLCRCPKKVAGPFGCTCGGY
jgi:hypothetical protein